MIVKICSLIILFIAFSGNLKNCSNQQVTVIGTALNEKDCAVVETAKGSYLLKELYRWDEKYYGKKVKVTGKLVIETHERESTDSMEVQERVGTYMVLKRPKWSLAE